MPEHPEPMQDVQCMTGWPFLIWNTKLWTQDLFQKEKWANFVHFIPFQF